MRTDRSEHLFRRASEVIPGGVNSPVRAFRSVGGSPRFMAKASGSSIWDEDGNRYLDYIGSWGPMILGHADPRVTEAVIKAAEKGTSFGAATEIETEMAELICRMVPGIEMVRMVNSGTEATMSAVRLARAFTGREAIIKFEGCYHGHADPFLIKAGSGAMTFGTPDSPGVPAAVAAGTRVARFNDISSVREQMNRQDVAAVIIEPVVGNMGCVPPRGDFLRDVRDLCTERKTLLLFDEVMTGFRLAPGGAQERFGITADLVTLGKVIGGGLPVGAYGGRKEIMQMVSPAGPVYQAGTLSGNPLAMAAGIATLRILDQDRSIYQSLEEKGARLEEGIEGQIRDTGALCVYQRVGSMGTLFFSAAPVTDYDSASRCDTEAYGRFFRAMLELGISLPPSQFEAAFLSAAHSDEDIDQTVSASGRALEAALRR